MPTDRFRPLEENDLREQSERLQLALEATGLGTWEMDLVSGRRIWSSQTRKLHGLETDGGADRPVELTDQLMHPEDRARLSGLHAELRAGRDDYEFIYRTARNGEQRWIEARGTVLERDGSVPTRIVGVCADITEKREAEVEKRRASERLETAESAAAALVYDWNHATGHVWRSNGLTRLLGWQDGEVAPTPEGWSALIHPDDRQQFLSRPASFRNGDRYVIEYRVRHKDGHYIWVMDSGRVIRDGDGAIVRQAGATIDITLRRQTERALRRQATLIDLSFEPIFVWSAERGIVEWNQGAEQVYGYTRAEALGRDSHELLRTGRNITARELLDYLESRQSWTGEVRHRTKDGRILTMESRHQLIKDDGEFLVLETNHDISDRKRAEADTARMAAVAIASHDALYGASLDGIIETWNPGAERLLGFTAEDAVGQHIGLIADELGRNEQMMFLARVARGERVGPVDTRRRHKDGTMIDVSVAMAPVMAPDGSAASVSVALHDITERKKWEAQQRLMTRELAHRVKNSFAVLLAILRSTLASSENPEQFAAAFAGRLHSLAAAQDILTESDWASAELGLLARHLLAHYGFGEGSRVTISGPPTDLGAEFAAPFALLLNELATNALKHGALSAPEGKIGVSWSVTPVDGGAKTLFFTWRETGGPPVKRVTRHGFGSKLIENGIPGAKVSNDFRPEGLVCTVELALTASSAMRP